jgi:hypothetical protein
MNSSILLLAAMSFSPFGSLKAPEDNGFSFVNRQHMVIVSFTTWNHHIYVKARVNNSPDLDFLFDPTAQGTDVIVDPAVAATGNFPKRDSIVLWLKTLKVSEQKVTWSSQKALEAAVGHSLNGVLGYGFIRNFVVRFDARHGRMILTDPAYFEGNTLKGKVPLQQAGLDLPLLLREGKTVTLNYPSRYMIISE